MNRKDSPPFFFSPKMKFLQSASSSKNHGTEATETNPTIVAEPQDEVEPQQQGLQQEPQQQTITTTDTQNEQINLLVKYVAEQSNINKNLIYEQSNIKNLINEQSNINKNLINEQSNINKNLIKLMDKLDRYFEKFDVQLRGPSDPTSNKDNETVDKKFIQDTMEFNMDVNKKQKLHGHQHYVKLHENEKTEKLINLLDQLKFNQAVIFVKSASGCTTLCKSLAEQGFGAIQIHHEIPKEKRLACYKAFKESKTCVIVTTNLFEPGINIEHVNIVFNYDMPEDIDTYLHQIAGARPFGTKGLTITFIVDENDSAFLGGIENRLQIKITEMPDELDAQKYI